eukprot:CAMPEP_0114302492 /NCGR_PEP_ID=MMETSP0059-20121206/14687_1 /TAXON_ID=36894 /ORGANISM="Pyramimonas parkeae, Strain CCMP726" /LENGTH=393 /DNA_ID=CAMNT_0001425337 /DNA_START=276 /DNA_END=1457 /DNA_ORIENTATION=+
MRSEWGARRRLARRARDWSDPWNDASWSSRRSRSAMGNHASSSAHSSSEKTPRHWREVAAAGRSGCQRGRGKEVSTLAVRPYSPENVGIDVTRLVPTHILLEIFRLVPPQHRAALRVVCKLWLSMQPVLWLDLQLPCARAQVPDALPPAPCEALPMGLVHQAGCVKRWAPVVPLEVDVASGVLPLCFESRALTSLLQRHLPSARAVACEWTPSRLRHNHHNRRVRHDGSCHHYAHPRRHLHRRHKRHAVKLRCLLVPPQALADALKLLRLLGVEVPSKVATAASAIARALNEQGEVDEDPRDSMLSLSPPDLQLRVVGGQVHMRFQENSSMSIMYAVKRLCPHQRWWHDTPTQWVLHLEALPQLFRNFLEEGLDFTQNCGLTQLLQYVDEAHI